MAYRKFKKWLLEEKKDAFGFELKSQQDRRTDAKPLTNGNKPIIQINFEQIMEFLSKYKVGTKEPSVKFVNEIHWGRDPGALRAFFNNNRNLVIDRKGINLYGEPIWITKEVYQLNPSGVGGFEEIIAAEVINRVEKVDALPLDSPKREFNEMGKLVKELSSIIMEYARPMFYYQGIKKIDDFNYIIRLGVKGGVADTNPDVSRVLENQTYVSFNRGSGTIHLSNYNIECDIGRNTAFDIQPPDMEFWFFPTQDFAEMIRPMAINMHYY